MCMFDIHNNMDENHPYFNQYSSIINNNPSFKELLSLIDNTLSFEHEFFIRRKNNEHHNLFSSIIESSSLEYNETITLLSKLKSKNFPFEKIPYKEVIENIRYSSVSLSDIIDDTNHNNQFCVDVLKFFNPINTYCFAFVAFQAPELIPQIWNLRQENIEKKHVIESYFFDIMFKTYYASLGSNKQHSMKNHLALMLLSESFCLEDLKEGYLLAENNPKFMSYLNKPYPSSFCLNFKDEIKKFVFFDLEKQILLNSLNKEEILNNSENKKRL